MASAGDSIASAWYGGRTVKSHRYAGLYDAGSDGTDSWYATGHRGKMYGSAQNSAFADNTFSMYIYYRTSNTGTWYTSNSVTVSEGTSKTIYGTGSHSHYLRWRGKINIGGDHKAYCGFSFTIYQMGAITHSSYSNGEHLKVGVLATHGTNPSYATGTLITGSHFLIYKP